MGTTTFIQTAFRFRNDNGSQSEATWKDTENNSVSIQMDTTFRVRVQIDENNGAAWSNGTFTLRYSKNSGAYTLITSSSPVKLVDSSYLTDGTDSTAQLSAPSGAFLADNNAIIDTTNSITNSGAKNDYFEAEYALQIDSSQSSENDTFDFRIYYGGATISAYSYTPRATAIAPPYANGEASMVTESFLGTIRG